MSFVMAWEEDAEGDVIEGGIIMIISIPVDEENLETKVSISFGRTNYFMLYDTDKEEASFIDNSAIASSGGAGIKAAQILVDNKVDAILTPRCGQNASDVLEGANIKLYKTTEPSAKENIDKFLNDELILLDEIHPGHHGGN